jgi:eukaryotic-like serine/threonine-protein kinase
VEHVDPVEARARGRLGQTLRGKYRLDRLLGVGGMAAVYAGVHRNGRPVAVKLLHPELTLHEGIRERFLREGQVANAVGHPGAVAVLDDDLTDDGAAFLVMELLDGATIESLSEHSRLPVAAVCSVGLQVLEVLEAAHARGVVHRDIKPANLFATRDGAVKILDFGIARLREPGTGSATQTGLMLGTPAFMAPEQAMGRMSQIDARTDLWALGATLFTLISGQPVHEAETLQEALVKAATLPARSLAAVAPTTPAWLIGVVDKVLSFEQSARFSTAREMHAALAAGAGDTTLETLATLVARADSAPNEWTAKPARQLVTHGGVVAPSPPAKRSRSGWVLALGLAIVGIGIAVAKWRDGLDPALVLEPAGSASAPVMAESSTSRTEGPESSSPPVAAASAAAVSDPTPVPRKPANASRSRAPAPSPAISAARPAAPALTPAPAARTDCNPPYRLDSSGVKIWKRECF